MARQSQTLDADMAFQSHTRDADVPLQSHTHDAEIICLIITIDNFIS